VEERAYLWENNAANAFNIFYDTEFLEIEGVNFRGEVSKPTRPREAMKYPHISSDMPINDGGNARLITVTVEIDG
jgi:hypothetical protein